MSADDDSDSKPYDKVYRGGGGRRRSVDDELAGLRPPRGGEPRPAAQPPRAARGHKAGVRRATRPDRAPSAPRAAARTVPALRGRRRGGRRAAGAARTARARRGAPARGAARRARRRRFRWWHVPLALLTLLVVAGVVVTVIAYPKYKRFDRAVDRSNRRLGPEARAALTPDDGMLLRNPTTVLLLGTDSVNGEPARSDTIMLMRFDPRSHTVNQLSVPRDTRVEVPGHGAMKINEAMFWGGPALAVETVERYVGIPINHVMVVDFRGFPRVVDVIGGVDFYVPKTISTSPLRAERSSRSRRAGTTSTARTPSGTCASGTSTTTSSGRSASSCSCAPCRRRSRGRR